jgi:hypothetical protein
MDLVCPECRGELVTLDGKVAHCTTHGGRFDILFSRRPPPAPILASTETPDLEYVLTAGAMSLHHPQVAAAFACSGCGTPICQTCAFPASDGRHFCPQCAARLRDEGRLAALVNPSAPPVVSRLPEGVRCVQHLSVQAVQQCQMCGAFMCATCDFALPGGLHVCPACATGPKAGLSARRKKLMAGSYALAVWCTLGMAVVMSGALAGTVRTKADEQMLGVAMTFLVLVPGLIGLALGFSAVDRRFVNPPPVWVAIAWNGLIVAGFLLLSLVGIFM